MNLNPNNSWKRDLLLLFFGIGIFFCIGLGERAYITPSEARYIEIPRQIFATGDWLTPHINGVQYFEKPPLFYWLQAAFLSLGNNEFFGRMATSLVVTLTCLITYATGRLLYGRQAGLLAAIALATSLLGYGLSRIAMLDAPVTLFITSTIASFIFAHKTGRKKYYYIMYFSAALAVMTKGLIGIVIPALVIGTWIAITKNWKILLQAKLITGFLLFLAIATPWHILMQIEHPDFFNFYFINEHFERFLNDGHKRTAPWWFFIAVTLGGSMPWIVFITPRLLRGLGQQIKSKNSDSIFLILWVLLPLIFFSSSHSKLVPYIFPIFPPLFIFIGKHLSVIWPARRKLITNLIIGMGLFCISANFIAGDFDKRSVKKLVEQIKPELKPEDMVVAYSSYWQDIPVYLNRNIIIVDWFGELHYGVQVTPNAKDWMIDKTEFWKRFSETTNTVYIFMNKEEFSNIPANYSAQLQEIGKYGNTILLKKDYTK